MNSLPLALAIFACLCTVADACLLLIHSSDIRRLKRQVKALRKANK